MRHNTFGCVVPGRSSVAGYHAAVAGETAKVAGLTSAMHIGEAHFTPARGGPFGGMSSNHE